MKGVFIHEQLEYRIECPKEDIQQGDLLPCRLTVKNHASSSKILAGVFAELAYGDPKADKEASYETLQIPELSFPAELGAQQSHTCEFTIQLSADCPITEKSRSLVLRYGSQASGVSGVGIAPLAVQPHKIIRTLAHTLESTFQFVLRGEKSKDGWVEVKFKPSSAKRFQLVDELTLCATLQDAALLLRFVFKVKKLDASGQSVSVKKSKVEAEKRIEEKVYMRSGFLDHEVLDAALSEALESVASDF